MDEAEKIVFERGKVYGDFSKRSYRYVCSGVDLKAERVKDVTERIRNGVFLDDDMDTIIDLIAYSTELHRRLKEKKENYGEEGKTPSGLVFCGR